MIIARALLNYDYATHNGSLVHMFTGNAYITKDGRLVMGRGAALQVKNMYPGSDKAFADVIGGDPDYGVRILPLCGLGVFQVKYHFREAADLDLIENSAYKLKLIAETHPTNEYRCNFPGVGNGRRGYEEVMEVLEEAQLPDNVKFFYLEDVR